MHFPVECPSVLGNLTLLQQILTNLIDNAVKYRQPDLPLEISVECTQSVDSRIAIAVADNGIGIAEDMQEKVFDIFQRLHGQEEVPGTGIGLALVKKAVGFLDGTITLTSAPGEGSTFTVVLRTAGGPE